MFIPLISEKNYLMESPTSIKYFLSQAIGSLILLVFIVFLKLKSFSLDLVTSPSLLAISMAIKSGIPPFHFWFPQVIELSNWTINLLLLTLQKIIPLSFLSYGVSDLFILIIVTRGLVGRLGGFNQNSSKKILAYSSIVHSGWMILGILLRVYLIILYFIIYSLLSLTLVLLIRKNSLTKIRIVNNFYYSNLLKLTFCLNLLSLGGLPPLTGFINKMLVVFYSVESNYLLVLIIIISSLISLTFYIRLTYSIFAIKFNLFKEKLFITEPKLIIIIYSTIILNLLIPLGLVLSY